MLRDISLVAMLVVIGAKYVVLTPPNLSLERNNVLENSSLDLTCHTPTSKNYTKWGTLNNHGVYSYVTLRNGTCSTVGNLANKHYFETRCYSNGTFVVTIKSVNISQHGQEWYCCTTDYADDNSDCGKALLSVEVPITNVTIKNNIGDILKTVEKMKSYLTCETSEGRPAANITWTKISNKGKRTNLTHGVERKTLTERNMTVVTSSIDIFPTLADNDSRIMCKAINVKGYAAEQEITIYVQYPPRKPEFVINERKVKDSVWLMYGSNVSVVCESNSFPYPSYLWNSTSMSKYQGQYLNISTMVGNETWQCTATNDMALPNKTKITGKSSAQLAIYLFNQSEIDIFYVIGNTESEVYEVTESDTINFNCSVKRSQETVTVIVLSFRDKELIRNNTDSLIYTHIVTSCLDDGVYVCKAINKQMSKQSRKELRLNVNCTPVLSPEFDLNTNVSSEQSMNITFNFKAVAYPMPDFIWFKMSGISWKSLENCTKYEIYTVDNYSNLTVRNITDKDYGTYKLRIENDVGSLEQLYFLNSIESFSLIEKQMYNWINLTYIFGGIIFIVSVSVVTWIARKRWLRHQSSDITLYQNVSFSVPENHSHDLPLNTQMVDHENLYLEPLVQTEVAQSQVIVKPEEVFQNREEVEFDREEVFSEPTEYYNSKEIIMRIEKIKVTELYDYVIGRTDESFNSDFQKIQTGFQMTCSFARKPENISLNRYKDILPYDHTRVCIDSQEDFFINASYIDGYHESKAYIACLGPTATTHDNFKTFWQMVWHEKSELIVMVTNLNESSGMKCEQYWPDASQDEMYGDILVSCQTTEMFAEYTLRTFSIRNTTNTENICQHCLHLHYTAWPDKKPPEDVASFLEFRQKYHDIRTTVNGPVVVHCSAGIGRTGVFIALDRLILEGKNEGSVNVVGCITNMREQRMKMVQTSEQYRFIFEALTYALNFDCESIPTESLTDDKEIVNEIFLERQYKELQLSLERDNKENIDGRKRNKTQKDKNREGADIPDNRNRVYLYLNRTFEDSDYINAVYINSYNRKNHFIMAQSPLPGMESDFLTMIYQENCFCVVSMEESNGHELVLGRFAIKEHQSLHVDGFTISYTVDETKEQYTVRKVTIKNENELPTDGRSFYHFHYNNWTKESDIPGNAEEYLEFVKDIQDFARPCDEGLHVLVYCQKANERSCLFCAIAIIREKLLFDEQVSILNTLRHLRTRRQTAITSMEQLRFCYTVAGVIAQMQNKGMYSNVL